MLIEVFVKHTSVEIIKDSKFDSANSFQGISLCFSLFDIQQVNWLAVGSRHLSQERKTATNKKQKSE